MKEEVIIRLVSKLSDLPDFHSRNFFHSKEMFCIMEHTPSLEPCMAIAEDGQGCVVAHMLVGVFRHRTLFPPFVYWHGRAYGEGEYDDSVNRDRVFCLFLKAVTDYFRHKRCLYVEFSDLSSKMFGYDGFRRNHYFPVKWQEVHNSLHSVEPSLRLSEKMLRRISEAKEKGVASFAIKEDCPELRQAYRLLKRFFRFKPRRSIPDLQFFRMIAASDNCRMNVTCYKGRVIGVSVCVYSEGNAYMWHMASLRKTHHSLHPTTFTVWSAIDDAHKAGMRHIYFLDAGLPFERSRFRDFILSFGGKQVSKYRWFRIGVPGINRLVDRLL